MRLEQFDSRADDAGSPLPVVVILGASGVADVTADLIEKVWQIGELVVLFPASEPTSDELDGRWPEDLPLEVLGIEHLHVVDDRGTPQLYAIESMEAKTPLSSIDFTRRAASVFGDRALVVACGTLGPPDKARLEDAANSAAGLIFIDSRGGMNPQLEKIERHLKRVHDVDAAELSEGLHGELHREIQALLPEFADAALRHATLDLRHYKHGPLVRRIAQRIGVVSATSPGEYLAQLQASASEALILVQSILIGVTSFFRDTDAFEALRARLEARIIEDVATGVRSTLRIWVPGCSSGEEAYSLAIIASELLERMDPERTFEVFGTDLNAAALVKARRGEYAEASLSPIDSERRERYFTKRGDRWKVRDELRERVLFSIHNLINDPPFNRMDLVSCRNLMIYLGPHLQKKLFPLFHLALSPGGTLFLGSSESLQEHKALFDPVEEHFNIGARRDVAPVKNWSVERSPETSLVRSATEGGRFPVDATFRPKDLVDLMRGIVIDEFAPPSLVIDGDGQIRATSPDIDGFLRVPAGEFKNNIYWLAHPGLRPALRATIGQAIAHKRRVATDQAWTDSPDGQQRVMITVQPMPNTGTSAGLLMVIFQVAGLPLKTGAEGVVDEQDHTLALEAELSRLRSEHEETVQRLESVNEELKSGNEALISINEKLRSTNDELKTSKEEVQRGLARLADAHSYLENLLLSTEVATIFLDTEGKILRVTPSATRVFNILPTDVGRPLAHLTHLANQMPPLEDGEGSSELRPLTLKDGTVMQRRVRPLTAADGETIGRVITFDDITTVDRARREADERAEVLGAIYASAGVGLALVDQNFDVRSANRQFETLQAMGGETARKADGTGALSRSLQLALPPDLMEGIQSPLLDLVANRRSSFHLETRGRDKNGHWKSWRVSGRRTSERTSENSFTLAIDDITELVEAENRALKSRAVLQSIVDAVQAFLGVCDQDGRLTECNRRALDVIDAELEDVVGLPFEETPWWGHDEEIRSIVKESVQRALTGESVSRTLTYQQGTGEIRHLVFQAGPMTDASGQIHQAVVSGFDTEERYQTSEQLRIVNRQLEIALRTVELGTWWWYTDSEELIWDSAQRLLWGFSDEDEVSIETAIARVHPEDREELDRKMQVAIETSTKYENTFRILLDDGTIRRLGAQGEAFVDEESGRNVLVGVNWDTTAEFERSRELEEAKRQAEAANRAKSEFLANMSHEIRTPMTAILGYADILAKHLKDPDNTSLVETIRRNGRFLLEILNDILDLAKIESGMLPVQFVPTPPEAVVEEVASLMQVRAIEKGIDLEVKYGPELPVEIDCDPVRLRQVLLNLVGNAIKFTDEGGVSLRVTADDANAVFEVIDSGIGIPADHFATLFEPFTQIDNSTQRERGGTGLGLTISRRLCRAMSGDLTVESQPSEGSIFTVRLPLKENRRVPRTILPVSAPQAESQTAESEFSLGGHHVLIVDDRRDVRTLIQFLFEDMGATVVLASNGEEGVQRYQASLEEEGPPIDLIIMDMQMPVMDGYTAATNLRQRGCELPIIAVTAHAMQGELEKCLAAGCSEYTTKPINGNLLLGMAARLLQGVDR